ncbi:UbiX family flavin prenyltransferase [Candidatus Methylacidithermus pantelleriae]|uniref:Flavin prenyltransferase UbiX n=1 Tax=Candidatus Methylacidithermus pantelleriae TaxID=2744239 RepID=A0A8J2FS51_9BACT|nr:UbiX family flavin prenyltransferase [Candidatus Methylacidithermus pantelleriae]CAF0693627.1 Flavin prenyltransferase UbiX [Candidatus Methylacidithermus pantelleriae]
MKLLVAITGASGMIYARRLLSFLSQTSHVVHIIVSQRAKEVLALEGEELPIPKRFPVHSERSLRIPFASGSARFDGMVIVPCSMATFARIAHGISDNSITRAADVCLKERRRLILVPREMPWNAIHARNAVTLLEAGAIVIPACPSFYSRPTTLEELADTVVARVLDQLGIPNELSPRWMDTEEG